MLTLVYLPTIVEQGEPLTVLGTGSPLRQFIYSKVGYTAWISHEGWECPQASSSVYLAVDVRMLGECRASVMS